MKTKNIRRILSAALAFAAAVSVLGTPLIDANFEGRAPAFKYWNVKNSIDTSRAHSGKSSLRLESTADWGGNAAIDLDGLMDFTTDCEFTVWVYAEEPSFVDVYISGDDGEGRHSIVNVGAIEPGKWSLLRGIVRASDWRLSDKQVKIILKVKGTAWFDDLLLSVGSFKTPSDVWPKVSKASRKAADHRATTLKPGASVTLDARNAALLPDTADTKTSHPSTSTAVIPAEGMLVFAIDAKDDLDITGSILLDPDADLRPGLRVCVLADDTVLAAPSVRAAPWMNKSGGSRPGPAPVVQGERPPAEIQLAPWRATKGRHYIAVSGPHIRSAGTFGRLELRAAPRPAEKPLHTFALLSDTHLGTGSFEWTNNKMMGAAVSELEATLRQLKREGASYALIAGDITDEGHRGQYSDLARAVKRAGLPVYACLGGHDTFAAKSRENITTIIPQLFPSGVEHTDYVVSRPPLRFIVLDQAWWRGKNTPIQGHRSGGTNQEVLRDGVLEWLQQTLASDTATPTIVVAHHEFYIQRGVTSSGLDLGKPMTNQAIMDILKKAPNVIATFNGHHHYNEVAMAGGITCVQNPPYVEWPNAYRVFRVYPDRLEWEVRQISNRGLIRESVVHRHALTWMLSTHDNDLAGTIRLAPGT